LIAVPGVVFVVYD